MNIIVTGTAHGIGKAIAERFINRGHKVYGFDIDSASLDHPSYTHIMYDVADTFLIAPSIVPDPDILINNAGTLNEDDALAINLEGAINFTELYENCESLRSVLFIASASARNGAEFPRYVASKAGLVGYMKNLALRLAPRGITVNSISPGGVITSANAHILNNERLYEAVLAETLLGKWAEADEVADLAWYLTMVNRSITGEDILMDNGEMLKSNFIW